MYSAVAELLLRKGRNGRAVPCTMSESAALSATLTSVPARLSMSGTTGNSPVPALRSSEEVPMKRLAAILVAVATVTTVGAQQSSTPTARAAAGDLHEGRRAHPAAQLPALPSPRLDRADVAPDVSGCAAVGALDQAEGRRARDAAVAHRSQHRHHQVQGRSVADRRRDRHDRAVGRRRSAAGQPGRHAASRASSAISIRGSSASPTSSSRWTSRTSFRQTGPTTSWTCSSTRASPKTCTSWRSRASRPIRRASRSCITSRRTSSRIRKKIRSDSSSTNTRSARTATSFRRTRAA